MEATAVDDAEHVHDDTATGWRPGLFLVVMLTTAALFFAGMVGYVIGGDEADPTSVDVGFLEDMIDHHGQAVTMSKIMQTAGGDPSVLHFANEVIATQQYENGLMNAWLGRWGRGPGDPDRRAMAWMGPGFPVDGMPGMAGEDDMTRLAEALGRDADVLFLRLLIAHHRGGIGMSEAARRNARDVEVRALADRISRYQSVEIRELEAARRRLGLPG